MHPAANYNNVIYPLVAADTTPGQQHSHHQRVKETPSCHLIPLLGIHHQEAGRSFLISFSAGMAPPVINQAESSSQRLPSPMLLDDDRAAAAGTAPLLISSTAAAESDQTTPRTSSDTSQLLHDYPAPAVKKRERWTDDEHKMFLIGLELYNKGQWKIISKEIFSGKKTVTQIASHAQKYFQSQAMDQQQQLLQEQQDDGDGANAMKPKRQRIIDKVDDAELDALTTKKLISEKVAVQLRAARSGSRSDLHISSTAAAESDQTTPRTSADPSQLLDDDSAPAVTKGGRWTEDEHMMFLIGLEIYNKGQWKIISKEIFSGKKTEVQLASHAHSYFQRQEQLLEEQGGDAGDGGSKPKWWWRLLDINTVEDKELDVLVSKKLISKKIEARFRAAREQH
ncbi:hypothetical protein Dimus_031355 [Dionaea muscipula]